MRLTACFRHKNEATRSCTISPLRDIFVIIRSFIRSRSFHHLNIPFFFSPRANIFSKSPKISLYNIFLMPAVDLRLLRFLEQYLWTVCIKIDKYMYTCSLWVYTISFPRTSALSNISHYWTRGYISLAATV